METLQVTITLDGTETAMLRRTAMRELRKPRDQARYLLRQALLAATGNLQENANRAGEVYETQPSAVAPQAPLPDWSYRGEATVATTGGGLLALRMAGPFADGRPDDGEYEIVLQLRKVQPQGQEGE